jgi:hypothetical protein
MKNKEVNDYNIGDFFNDDSNMKFYVDFKFALIPMLTSRS